MSAPQRAAPGAAELLLIRHGETAWNAEQRIQGHLDIPLSARGAWQARRLAERLGAAPADIAAVVTSDLARAAMTAAPLAERLGLPLQRDARLRERDFGIFQGLRPDEVATRWPQAFAAWRSRDPAWAMEGGESALAFGARVLAALHDHAAAFSGRRVAIVAHGGVLDVSYRHARGLPWDAPREHVMLNAAVNRVQAQVSAAGVTLRLLDWGDTAHLDGSRDEALA